MSLSGEPVTLALDTLFVIGIEDPQNTLLYIQLEEALFKDTSDEFTCKVVKKVKEATDLIECFEYITDMNDVKLFGKRKLP